MGGSIGGGKVRGLGWEGEGGKESCLGGGEGVGGKEVQRFPSSPFVLF